MGLQVGIDLGGTNIAGGIVSEEGKVLCRQSVPTGQGCSPERIADQIAALCRELVQESGIAWQSVQWIGVGVPGSVERKTGTVEYANNINFVQVPLRQMLEERLNCRAYIENDANSAAWGEYQIGAGKGCSSMVMLTLGTGIGGGIIENGRLLSGCNGAAGELGHFVLDLKGKPCNCGLRGCFEQYGSVTALIEQTKFAMRTTPDSLMHRWAAEHGGCVDGRTPFEAMRAGDPAAKKVVQAYVRYLCLGITSIINIFQPEMLCLGGGISREGETLLGAVRAFAAQHDYARGSVRQTRIAAAVLQNDAGVIGAALLGKEQEAERQMPIV